MVHSDTTPNPLSKPVENGRKRVGQDPDRKKRHLKMTLFFSKKGAERGWGTHGLATRSDPQRGGGKPSRERLGSPPAPHILPRLDLTRLQKSRQSIAAQGFPPFCGRRECGKLCGKLVHLFDFCCKNNKFLVKSTVRHPQNDSTGERKQCAWNGVHPPTMRQ